ARREEAGVFIEVREPEAGAVSRVAVPAPAERLAHRGLVRRQTVLAAPIVEWKHLLGQLLRDALAARAEHDARALCHPDVRLCIHARARLLAFAARERRGGVVWARGAERVVVPGLVVRAEDELLAAEAQPRARREAPEARVGVGKEAAERGEKRLGGALPVAEIGGEL